MQWVVEDTAELVCSVSQRLQHGPRYVPAGATHLCLLSVYLFCYCLGHCLQSLTRQLEEKLIIEIMQDVISEEVRHPK